MCDGVRKILWLNRNSFHFQKFSFQTIQFKICVQFPGLHKNKTDKLKGLDSLSDKASIIARPKRKEVMGKNLMT